MLGHCTFASEFWRVGRHCRGQHHPPYMVGLPSPFQVEVAASAPIFGSHAPRRATLQNSAWRVQQLARIAHLVLCSVLVARSCGLCSFALRLGLHSLACTRLLSQVRAPHAGFMLHTCTTLLRVMAFALCLACHSLAFARVVPQLEHTASLQRVSLL